MSKKTHIGNGGTPRCASGICLGRTTRVRPSITVDLEKFKTLNPEDQCQRCAKSIDTSNFAAELGSLIFGGKAS